MKRGIMGYLSLNFFDSFQTTLDGKSLSGFRSAKVQGLLAYIALTNPQIHSREVLAALLWPEEPDSVAKKNLRQSLYQLRQVLNETVDQEGAHLLVTRSTVQFNPDSAFSLDVADFLNYLKNDQPEHAIPLFKGELLAGFSCDSLPFEEWLREEQERLHRLALDALFELTARSLERADYASAQDLAQRQLALEPWREEAHRQLMQALALLGERSAALAQYESCKQVLEEELGVQPAVETENLAARIRDQQLERSSPRVSELPVDRQQLIIPFIGRKSEHGALSKAYQRAVNGDAQVVALLGEAGIGKTRLAQNFLDWAATQGADILRGRAFGTSGRLSYQPLTQVLRQRLEQVNAPEDLLSDLWLTQLTRILPELRDRYPDLPAPTQEEAAARQHLFEAITRLILALAERAPLVIFIDDWHWADAASLDVLHYAAVRLKEEQAPALVLLTIRQEDLKESSHLQTWLMRLKHDAACKQISLASFSRTETERLIRRIIASMKDDMDETPTNDEETVQLNKFTHRLFEETDGQPFFLVEMLRALAEEGLFLADSNSKTWRVDWQKFNEQALDSSSLVLPGISEIIQGWLERISTNAGALLAATAVLDQDASFERLCRVAGIDETQALPALDELLDRRLLIESEKTSRISNLDPTYSFSHQKVGEVVYRQAGAARRRILHRRAFEALRETAAPAAELALHALNAGLMAEAIQYSIIAGNEAMHLLATRVAIAHYETAMQLAEQMSWPDFISGADRQDLYTNLGRAYELTEAWKQAQEMYQTMFDYAQTIQAPAMECLALNHLATVHINGSKTPQQAIPLLEQARRVAEQSGDQRGLAETEWNLSIAARMQQDTQLSRQHGEQALALARQLGHPQLLARCLNSLAYVHGRLRQWDKVKAYAREASDLYRAAGNRILEADSQRMLGWSQLCSGRPHESLATLRETLSFSRQIENLWGEAEASWRLAGALLELGQYGEAVRLSRRATQQTRRVGQPTMIQLALTTWGAVQRSLMALEAARETLLEALDIYKETESSGFRGWILSELCASYALSGDWDQAYIYARELLAFRDDTLPPMGITGWYETEALLRGGDGDMARAEDERLAGFVENNRRQCLPWLRSQAVLAQWDGDIDQAIIRLETARNLAQEIGLPGEEWPILDALGTLYAGQGDQDQAQRAWNTSANILHRLAESIDEEEMRTGFLESRVIQRILETGIGSAKNDEV
jgi:predicted ATPase/DNA-binding SARP family transcriptional activator